MAWRDLLASASAQQTLSRARSCLGKGTIYHLGGSDNDPEKPFPQECDCSGFVDWSMGFWRQLPPRSDHWLYTDSIWDGGGEVGHGLFTQVMSGLAQPGDFLVYPSPSPHHVGHIGIVVTVSGGVPTEIIHCSSTNYHNTNDAVRVAPPTVFTQNPHSRIMRPNYDALRAKAGTAGGGNSGGGPRGARPGPADRSPHARPTAPLTARRYVTAFNYQDNSPAYSDFVARGRHRGGGGAPASDSRAEIGRNDFNHPSTLAVGPEANLPFGSRVFIDGLGWFLVEDRTAAGLSNAPRFDIWTAGATQSELSRLTGTRNVTVFPFGVPVSADWVQRTAGAAWDWETWTSANRLSTLRHAAGGRWHGLYVEGALVS